MKPLSYISTRGGSEPLSFSDAAMSGLATDGGLLVPASIPDASSCLDVWSTLRYQDLAFEVIRLFADLPEDDLLGLVESAYSTFEAPDITPLVSAGPVQILELFHGPTLAFKDVALQFLSRFFEYNLARTGGELNILGATSGDTGSAAIHGVRGCKGINIFIMHPDGRVAPLQEKQMTSVLDDNVYNLAVEGTFDTCQNIMKSIFSDVPYKQAFHLGSINSVNWARVMTQIVYYFYAGLRAMKSSGASQVSFSVPTGNFGDILAGWYAARMGLPVQRLVLATNENDILSRFFNSGTYRCHKVVHTLSPSMDIQVASNFERYLYHLVGNDAPAVAGLMQQFKETGEITVEAGDDGVDPLFAAGVGGRTETLETIARYYRDHGYLLDPHTAVGVSVAEPLVEEGVPMVCLATAHPAKFPAAIEEALGEDIARHPTLDALADAETRCEKIAGDEQAVRAYLENKLSGESTS